MIKAHANNRIFNTTYYQARNTAFHTVRVTKMAQYVFIAHKLITQIELHATFMYEWKQNSSNEHNLSPKGRIHNNHSSEPFAITTQAWSPSYLGINPLFSTNNSNSIAQYMGNKH
jgi:hypothetical protein